MTSRGKYSLSKTVEDLHPGGPSLVVEWRKDENKWKMMTLYLCTKFLCSPKKSVAIFTFYRLMLKIQTQLYKLLIQQRTKKKKECR